MDPLRRQFILDPSRNPHTNKAITPDGPTFRSLVQEFRLSDPERRLLVVQPASPRLINRRIDGLQLLLAVRKGPRAVTELVEGGVDVNYRDNHGNTALLLAVKKRDHASVATLLEAGANPNCVNDQQQTPLLLAIAANDLSIIAALLRLRADTSGAFLAAVTRGHLHLLPLFPNPSTAKALAIATEKGHSHIVDYLLQQSPAPPLLQEALLLACKTNKQNIVTKLLASGADINQIATDGTTPLLAAARSNHPTIIKQLLTAGADGRQRDALGRTTLWFAALYHHLEVVKELLATGAPTENPEGSPLVAAAERGHADLVELLLPTTSLGERQHALFKAAECASVSVVLLLLRAGVDANYTTAEGDSVLLHSLRRGNIEVFHCLRRHGASIPYRRLNEVFDNYADDLAPYLLPMMASTVEQLEALLIDQPRYAPEWVIDYRRYLLLPSGWERTTLGLEIGVLDPVRVVAQIDPANFPKQWMTANQEGWISEAVKKTVISTFAILHWQHQQGEERSLPDEVVFQILSDILLAVIY